MKNLIRCRSLTLRRYNKDDYKTLQLWSLQYQSEMCPEESLPEIGFIEDGKAAGFLYQTDSNVAYLDLIIANKNQPHDQALNDVIDKLGVEAKERGFDVLIGISKHPVVEYRVERLGWISDSTYTVLLKAI